MYQHTNPERGLIAWFAHNPVAANLLMACLVIVGGLSALTIKKQMFPLVESTWISVNIPYRGAAPKDVEEAITTKLEEALASVQGLERVITYSNRGGATASLKVLDDYEPREVLDEVKSSIDSISSFPEGMERPIVSYQKFKQEVMYLSLSADLPLEELKPFGEDIYNEIRALPGVNIADYFSGADYEISIDVSQDKLREYKLGFSDIALAVRQFSSNRSAGEVRSNAGYISVRVQEQAYIGAEFEGIVIQTLPGGRQLKLGDIATVKDGFEQGVHYSKINGQNCVIFFVGASKDQSITKVSETVNSYIESQQSKLPPGVHLKAWVDFTYYLEGRLNMMLSNMLYGGLLVFIILSLFLRMRLAFWVMMGLPVSFLGAMCFLPLSWVDVTINVGSLFAFIMVLGVVVDDAIIIGESVQSEVEEKGTGINNVIRGAQRVAVPATFGVLTTMAAFLPMALASGPNAAFPHAIGYVVVLCLIFSLVESKLILPAHLARMKPEPEITKNPVAQLRRKVARYLGYIIQQRYTPFLYQAIRYRYTVMAIFTGLVIVTVSLFASSNIHFVGMPKVPHDYAIIEIEMNGSTSEQATLNTVLELEKMILSVDRDVESTYGQSMLDQVFVQVNGRTTAKLQAKLVEPKDRPIDTFQLSALWRKAMPDLPGIKQLSIIDNVFGGQKNDGDISFRLTSRDELQLKAAASDLKSQLSAFKGVYEVSDSEKEPVPEARFTLKPVAYSLGLDVTEVAAQASHSLYGIEAQRFVRDRQEIRVMVRYPEAERDTVSAIDDILIRTKTGGEVPLSEVVTVEWDESSNQIYKEDGRRAVTVWGSVDTQETEPLKVSNHLSEEVFPEFKRKYPQVVIIEAGKLKDQRADLLDNIKNILLILLPIYILLALPLRSYVQPVMIMSVIPFGVIGSIFGHIIMGRDLSMMSVFGIYAVVGVVVNDSLVMVDYVNKARAQGAQIIDAVVAAGQKRFRAIILTSLTTFIGLMPIISETSLQAQIVIPMAISLAFGVLFATLVTLILVPCLYTVVSDFTPKKYLNHHSNP